MRQSERAANRARPRFLAVMANGAGATRGTEEARARNKAARVHYIAQRGAYCVAYGGARAAPAIPVTAEAVRHRLLEIGRLWHGFL
jgi:hypothetical protein